MIKNRLKKFLCKKASFYENGQLKVPPFLVIIWGIIFSTIVGFAGWFVYSLIKTPIETIELLLLVTGSFISLWAMAVLISFIIPKTIIAYLKLIGSKIELTCDKIVFPEEVKNIFAQIESLDEEKQQMFLRGIYPLIRKLGEEE